ncbi:heterokaryon incompatibility, partial [Apodospora peruviana]
PTYSARSYVWGDPTSADGILLDGHPFQATKNLADGLRALTKILPKLTPDQNLADFRLWVDAVCINQEDHVEPNHEVARMGSIYPSALSVLAWLG